MADIVDAVSRSRMMAGIKDKNTRPEKAVRSGLHRLGLRFRLNGSGLSGRPDLVLRKHRTVVFVHGCFWHAHCCSAFHLPASNTDFWRTKLTANVARDARCIEQLHDLQWRTLIVWECAVRHKTPKNLNDVCIMAHDWIVNYDGEHLEIYRGEGNVISKCESTSRAL